MLTFRNFYRSLLFSLLACTAMPAAAAAQGRDYQDRMQPKFQGRMDMKPRVHEKVEQFKKMKLIEVLDMSEENSEKFFARYNTYQKRVDEAYQAYEQASRDLNQAVENKASATDIQKLTDIMIQKQNSLQDANNEKIKAMKTVLSEEQYAKYVMFEQKFMHELQRAIMQRKHKQNKD